MYTVFYYYKTNSTCTERKIPLARSKISILPNCSYVLQRSPLTLKVEAALLEGYFTTLLKSSFYIMNIIYLKFKG